MKRTQGKVMKQVRQAARAKLKDVVKEARKAQKRIGKHTEQLDQQVDRAVVAAATAEVETNLEVQRRFEALNKRVCVLGERCVYARDGKGRSFTPAITVSGRSTEAHCSVECASRAMGIHIPGYNKDLEQAADRKPRTDHLAAFREPAVVKDFKPGQEVVYQGGAKTTKFKEGDVLVVVRPYAEGRRYAVRGGKVCTVVASKYLTPKEGK